MKYLVMFFIFYVTISTPVKSQNLFNGSFSTGNEPLNKTSVLVELKDSTNNIVLSYSKRRFVCGGKVYLLMPYENKLAVIDSLSGIRVGLMSKSFRSFSVGDFKYKLSKRGRAAYNFVVKSNKDDIISWVKYAQTKNGWEYKIVTNGDENLLPFVFLVAINEIKNNGVLNWVNFLMLAID